MNNTKKLLSIILAMIMLSISLVGCGSEDKEAFKAANDEIVKLYDGYFENNEVKAVKLDDKYGDYKDLIEIEQKFLTDRLNRYKDLEEKMTAVQTTGKSENSIKSAESILDNINKFFDSELNTIKTENEKLIKEIKALDIGGDLMDKYIEQTEKRIDIDNKFYQESIKVYKELMGVFKESLDLSKKMLTDKPNDDEAVEIFQKMMNVSAKATELANKFKQDNKNILKVSVE